ncbi:MAG: hypothetical protein JWO88_2457 [Frankiales bacterium]|nr:hypothetical protein [Frankiales bacterium]
MAGTPKRKRGSPNPVADLRGGPGTFRGLHYQVHVGVVRLLTEVLAVWRDQLMDRHLRFELRELVDDGGRLGQFGYDIGAQTGAVITCAEEVKSAPGAADVEEFAARLGQLPPAFAESDLVLVVPVLNEPVRRLELLVAYAREAATPQQLARFVGRAAADGVKELLAVAGSDAHAVLRRASVSLEPSSVLETRHDVLTTWLAPTDRTRELSSFVMAKVTAASASRESVSVVELVDVLLREGLLRPAPAVDSHADETVLRLFVALEACPVPVPAEVLGAAIGVAKADEVVRAVQRLVDVRKVLLLDGGLLWRPPGVPPLAAVGHEDGILAVADALIDWAGRTPDARAAEQTPNMLALARRVEARSPRAAARAFTAFDKPSKTYGDLALIYDLAVVSRRAAQAVVRVAGTAPERDSFLNHSSRAAICGESWVLQRVGEYPDAARVLGEARDIAERTRDEVSLAFADKCLGRIERLAAEEARRTGRPEPEIAAPLERSGALLSASRDAFAGLASRGKAQPKDAAESSSLLARTHAVAGRPADAREHVDVARRVLASAKPGKEWADLRLLEAELDLREMEAAVGSGDDPEATGGLLERAEEAVQEVLEEFPPDDNVPWQRPKREITARALLLSGRLRAAAGDPGGARERLDEAYRLYDALGDDRAAAEAMYESLATAPGRIPPGLQQAAGRAGAEPAVVVSALRRHEKENPDMDDDDLYWEGLVRDTMTEVRGGRTPWADRRRTA